jgi:hypothetical protein
MTKKEYMKPTMRTVELKHRTKILTGSNFGMKGQLQDTEKESNDPDLVKDAW